MKPSDPSLFRDRHVVVTGATGELGGAVAELLVAAGARCHLPVRSAERLSPALSAARVVEGVDLGDERAVTAFYRDLPGLWASVHCAGAFGAGAIEETSLAELQRLLAVNTVSSFLCSREALRAMRRGPAGAGGSIVNVIARQALEPRRGAGMTAYTVSKAGVAALTVALAEEALPHGVRVNAVAPSVIDTPANRAAMPQADPSRWVKLAELAATIRTLAEPTCVVHGALVPVYGRA